MASSQKASDKKKKRKKKNDEDEEESDTTKSLELLQTQNKRLEKLEGKGGVSGSDDEGLPAALHRVASAPGGGRCWAGRLSGVPAPRRA